MDAGAIPAASTFAEQHEHDISSTNPQHITTLGGASPPVPQHEEDLSEHPNDPCVHEKCVLCVSHIPEDLATVVQAWSRLPDTVKTGMVAMVNAV
jgi:hypothetical protein